MNLVRNSSNILSRRSGVFRRVAASFYHSDEGVYGHAPDKKTRNLELGELHGPHVIGPI